MVNKDAIKTGVKISLLDADVDSCMPRNEAIFFHDIFDLLENLPADITAIFAVCNHLLELRSKFSI